MVGNTIGILLAMKKPYIKKQLNALPVDKLAIELKEYGAWMK
jgi:hypothetical protein